MLSDLRLALRRFRQKPGHTALIVLVLGLGTGSATAIFTVVDQTILRPPPFAHTDRLVEVLDLYRSAGARSSNLTPEKIAGWQRQPALFEAFEAFAGKQVDLITAGGEPERVRGLGVTTGLLPMLGAHPLIGRDFVDSDGRAGAERVVLISESLWRRRFGGQRQVLGASITLNDVPYSVIGVMPRQFRLTGNDEHLWIPVNVQSVASDAPQRFVGIGRLPAGLAPGSEQQVADTLAARLQSELPLPREPFWDIALSRKTVAFVPDSTRTALFVLLGAVGFVLLITCANTASLILSEVGVRARETAIRVSIGASRGRLFRSVLVESVLLAACGGGLGILLATWGVDAIVAAAPPDFAFASTSPIEVDGRILAFCCGATLLTGIGIGLVPALRGSRQDVDAILKAGSGGGHGRTGRTRLSNGLVAAEVAFSVILLVGAALMARTFANLHALDPGFDGDNVAAIALSLPTDKYVGEGARSAFFEALGERIRPLPGVVEIAVAAGVFDGSGLYFGRVSEVEGRDPGASDGRLEIPFNVVTDGYFRTLRIPVLAGRSFEASDGPGAVILSRALADRLWPNAEAVGRRFKLDSGYPWETVVGVVGNVEGRASGDGRTALRLYRRTAPAAAATGTPPRTRGYSGRVLLVRGANPLAAVPAIRAAVWSLDPNQPIGRVSMVSDLYATAFGRERFVLQLMAGFSLLAIILTATGLFGVLSQVVALRRREIGLRMALGAQRADVMRLVIGRGLVPLSLGIVAGIAGASSLARFLRALLFAVSPVDPGSFGAVAIAMIVIGLFACWLPTRRAVRVDPVVALRAE
jgi:putative ABC transport system permease protein